MKAAFCSSPRAGERGAPRASRRWFTTITGTTGSLRWRFLPSARPASGSLSMSLFRTRTSRPRTWGPSCGACCNIRQARSFFCGTRAKSIRGRPSERCSWTIRACKPNSFPSMLQNSTLSSKYGTISRATRPTVCRKTNMISESAFTPTPTGCAVPRTNCVPSSWPQNYRHHSTGNSRYITFAKRNSGELNTFTCKKCGKRVYIEYPTRYIDDSKRLMVWLLYGDEQPNLHLGVAHSFVEEAMSEANLRLVRSWDELIEKVRIVDAGLDDRVIELVKESHRQVLQQKGQAVGDIFFAKLTGGANARQLVFTCEKGDRQTFCDPLAGLYEIYERVVHGTESMGFRSKAGQWPRIDAHWMETVELGRAKS